ncbi:MAG: family 78 glycoside hydrolase catalytic domain [Planctomycetales bacterium]|nr:family 78 glycoside hydrolase catalytic domain [Planctomycetales bacterium]
MSFPSTMRLFIGAAATLSLLTSLSPASSAQSADGPGALTASRLRCEYRANPLGVDRARPELSWIVTSSQRNQTQSAYRVLVASSDAVLAENRGDLWDTGKTQSGATYGISYGGPALEPHQRVSWKVMTWDREGRAGEWSEAARWSQGMNAVDAWAGAWIGSDAGRDDDPLAPAEPFKGAQWICHVEPDVMRSPAERRVYVRDWDLPSDMQVKQATVAIAADDVSQIRINGQPIVETQNHTRPQLTEATAAVRAGRNEIRILCDNTTPGPTGVCVRLTIRTADNRSLTLVSDESWRSRSIPSGKEWANTTWEQGQAVHVVGPMGTAPWGVVKIKTVRTPAPSYLRGEFQIAKPVKSAVAYLASYGWADLSINGQRVNDDYFTSGWTDYHKRVYYRAYDAGNLVRQGSNAWGTIVADGWYSGYIGWAGDRDLYGNKPRVRVMLHVVYEDGSSDDFATDDSWQAVPGPTTQADILQGESYDATQENPGWDQPQWQGNGVAVNVGSEFTSSLQWHPGPPVVEAGEFPALSVSEPQPGVYVFDLGQNIAGVVCLKVRGSRGQELRLRHAERLNDDGTLYTINLRTAQATDRYVCRGEGIETWQPRQTFHGFQYVEVVGLNEKPSTDMITGVALSSDAPLASEFTCSDERLNRLYKNVLWTQRANFIDVPTDCPQRDERLGWTGDAQVYVHTACLVADVQAFFRKWLVDLDDAQRDDGQFPKVAPVLLGQEDGGPAWSEAGVICPWEIYQAYGDKQLLAQQYPSMVRFVEYCRKRSRNETLPPEQFHCFGDWLSVKADTPKEVIYTAYFARSADLLRKAAQTLGKTDDAQKYGKLFERIKQAFQREFVDNAGKIRGDTQCVYVLAIGYGLVDGPMREKAAERLVNDIRGRGDKLSTGFIGTKDLMLVLTEIGRTDVAFDLLHQRDYPGWLFSIDHGATSIWERWDGWTPERGFQDPGMNSFAHYSFGAVYGWMAENLGGMRSLSPGYADIELRPTFDPKLEHCRVEYDSVRGPIVSHWRRTPDGLEWDVETPANARAVAVLPGIQPDDVSFEDGVKLELQTITLDDGRPATLAPLGSGAYRLRLPAAK